MLDPFPGRGEQPSVLNDSFHAHLWPGLMPDAEQTTNVSASCKRAVTLHQKRIERSGAARLKFGRRSQHRPVRQTALVVRGPYRSLNYAAFPVVSGGQMPGPTGQTEGRRPKRHAERIR